MTRRAPVHLLVGLLVLSLLGCASHAYRAMVAARDAHTQCIAEHFESHPDCEVLKEHYLTAQRRYEQDSRRAWSCDPAREECPPPR